MKVKFASLTCLVLASCVGPKSTFIPPSTRISYPEIGQQVTVSVGDEMVSQGNMTYLQGIELEQENKIKGYTLSPGFYPMTADDRDVTYHSFMQGKVPINGYGALSKSFIVDPPKDIQASKIEQKICIVTVFGLKTCDTEWPYKRTKRLSAQPDQFQQTLLYSGRSGQKINIAYREFSGSSARPAFSNDVEYDLSVSDVIGYKGARLKVKNANNESITYILISNFK